MSYEYNLGTIKHLSCTSDLASMQSLRIRFIEQPKQVYLYISMTYIFMRRSFWSTSSGLLNVNRL